MEYVYAALLLHKLGKAIDEQGITKIVQAAGIAVDEAKVKTLVASLKGVDIEKAISEAAIAQAPVAKTEAKAEHKEEKKEAAAEGLASLFG